MLESDYFYMEVTYLTQGTEMVKAVRKWLHETYDLGLIHECDIDYLVRAINEKVADLHFEHPKWKSIDIIKNDGLYKYNGKINISCESALLITLTKTKGLFS